MATKKITDEQLADALNAGWSTKQIADEYGMSRRVVQIRTKKLAAKGAGHGGDVGRFVPEGYKVKGTSTMTDADGNVKLQWVKTDTDAEKLEAIMREAAEVFAAELPREEPQEFWHEFPSNDMLAMYPLFDLHIGALAHKHECGENYDTAEAERVLNGFIDYASQNATSAAHAVLVVGGDLLHSDGLSAVTPASGHVLDQDSRYAKIVHVALRSIRRAIRVMLQVHQTVEVQVIEGNHDESGMIWLRAALAAVYEDEPRVYVDTSPHVMHVTEWGKTLLGYTHGHTMKKPDVRLQALAADHREAFGKAKYVYTHSGHWHHQKITETAIGIDEVHGQLGAKDAYAARGGWRSMRQAAVILYSKEYGEVGRFIARPEMF